eukprot:Rmarinus@m.15313
MPVMCMKHRAVLWEIGFAMENSSSISQPQGSALDSSLQITSLLRLGTASKRSLTAWTRPLFSTLLLTRTRASSNANRTVTVSRGSTRPMSTRAGSLCTPCLTWRMLTPLLIPGMGLRVPSILPSYGPIVWWITTLLSHLLLIMTILLQLWTPIWSLLAILLAYCASMQLAALRMPGTTLPSLLTSTLSAGTPVLLFLTL